MTLTPLGGDGKTYRIADNLTTQYQEFAELSSLWTNTIAPDADIMEIVAASDETMDLHARTPYVMDAISGEINAMDAIAGSPTAMDAVMTTVTGRTAIFGSSLVTDTVWSKEKSSLTAWNTGGSVNSVSDTSQEFDSGRLGQSRAITFVSQTAQSSNNDLISKWTTEVDLTGVNNLSLYIQGDFVSGGLSSGQDFFIDIDGTQIAEYTTVSTSSWDQKTPSVSSFSGRHAVSLSVNMRNGDNGDRLRYASLELQ